MPLPTTASRLAKAKAKKKAHMPAAARKKATKEKKTHKPGTPSA